MTRRMLAVAVIVAVLGWLPGPASAQAASLQLDFRDAPLGAVLQALARAAGVNLLVEGEITGRVTLHLERLTFPQALRLLAAAYRLTYRVQDGAYVVRQLPAGSGGLILPRGAQDLPVQLRAYPLRHASAEEVAEALSQAVAAFTGGAQPPQAPQISPQAPSAPPPSAPPSPPQGAPSPPGGASYAPPPAPSAQPTPPPPAPAPVTPSRQPAAAPEGGGGVPVVVVADPGSNAVLVAAPVAVQLQVQEVLRVLDRPRTTSTTPQPPGAVHADPRAEMVGPRTVAYTVQYADLDQLKQILTSEVRGLEGITADPRTRRLLITGSARAREDAVRLIALLDRPTPQVLMSTRVVELTESASRRLGINWTWTPTVTVGGGVSVVGDAVGKISAAVEEGQGRVLANPTVAAADGRKATITAGTTLYIPITTTQNGQTVTTLQTVNAGIKLEVTPRITSRTALVAELNIEVNSLGGFGPQGFPIINTRAVSTHLEVADGAPIVIGGLISDTTTEILRKLPLLGDIPLLGELFRYREQTRNYSNIVVIIIPRVLHPADA